MREQKTVLVFESRPVLGVMIQCLSISNPTAFQDRVQKWRRSKSSTQQELSDSKHANMFVRPGPALFSWLRREDGIAQLQVALSRQKLFPLE